jgi:hypothetical protein
MEVLAACHVHSDWSYDGSWTLEELSAKFGGDGCRVLLMTEHDRGFTAARLEEYRVACAKVSSTDILVVPGIEYSDADNRVHVLAWGPVPFLGESLPTGEMLESVRSANGVAVLAHPSRKKVWESFSPYWTERLLGIEVWNRKYDGWAPSETSLALLERSSAIPFVGLDFHTHRQSFPLFMALDIDGNVTEDRVVDCLRSRHCSPRAFGSPLDQSLFRAALPALKIAERSRRAAASIARRTGIR